MKKINKKLISILLIFSMVFGYIVPVLAVGTTNDYSEMETVLPTEYAYGALIWGDETTVSVVDGENTAKYVKDFGEGNDTFAYEVGALENQIIKVRINKCAIDKDGDVCDVICTVDNIQLFDNPATTDEIGHEKFPDFEAGDIVRARLDVEKFRDSNNNETNLISIWFSTRAARNDFTMQYVKTGTSTPANITKVTSTIGDIDATYNSSDSPWSGNEAVLLDSSTSQIYYKKNNLLVDTENEFGVRINSDNQHEDNLEPNTSVVVLQDLENATYNLSYAGRNCGIFYVFASPQTFELPAPVKKVNKSRVLPGEEFIYSVTQYVPNNYLAEELSFIENNGRYQSFEISDELNSNLQLEGNTTDIDIVDENNKSVTDKFDITFENNKVTASIKAANLESIETYGHTYTIKIPVSVISTTELNVTTIPNLAITEAVSKNNPTPEQKQSNTVNVTLNNYNVLIDSEIDHGITYVNTEKNTSTDEFTTTVNPGENSNNIVYFKAEDGYSIVSVTIDGEQVPLTDCTLQDNIYSYPFNDTNINEDIEHHVVINTQRNKTTVTAIYVDEEDNEIAEPIIQEKDIDEAYETIQKTIPKYEFKEVEGEPTGNATVEPITVKYIYRLKDTTVTAIYVDEEDNPLADEVTNTYKVDAEYTTQAKEIPGYQLIATPTNANGTATEEPITVKYVYAPEGTSSVIINYLDEENNPIETPDTITGKVNDPYTTNPKEIPGYELVEEKLPTNATGNMEENPITVNYIYRVKEAKVIVKHVNTKGQEIAESTTMNKKYFESYDTSSKKIANYKLITTPSNASGTVNEDVITVTYVYDLKTAQVIVNHLDEDGKKIADSDTINGKVTEKYTTKKKNIKGYTLTKIPQNAEGTMTEETIVVNYIYSKNESSKIDQLPKTGNSEKYIIAIFSISVFAIGMAIAKNKYKEI